MTAHSDYPPAARKLPRVADAAMIDLENIVALQPDLVVAWPYTAPQQLAALRALKIPVFFSHPRTIRGIASDIEKLGMLAGNEPRGHAIGGRVARAARGARGEVQAAAPPVSVFYEIWNRPLYTIGGNHLISEAHRRVRRRNIFASLTLPAPEVNLEAVIAAAPEVIVGADDAGGVRVADGMVALAGPARRSRRQRDRGQRRPPASAGPALRRRRGATVRRTGPCAGYVRSVADYNRQASSRDLRTTSATA